MSSENSKILHLPREIRDTIYLYSIQSDHTLPTFTDPVRVPSGQLCYWHEHNKWQPMSLLAVSRQTRAETLDLIAQQDRTHALRFDLHVEVWGYRCRPTWTHLHHALRPHSHISLLHVDLCTLGTESFQLTNGYPRRPGKVFSNLLELFNRFVFHGPSFLDPEPGFRTPGPHFVEVLEVVVRFEYRFYDRPGDRFDDTWAGAVWETFRMLKALAWMDSAHQFLGRIRAKAEYEIEGKEVRREAEWKVRTGSEAKFSALREEDWGRAEFYFGDTWRQKFELA